MPLYKANNVPKNEYVRKTSVCKMFGGFACLKVKAGIKKDVTLR